MWWADIKLPSSLLKDHRGVVEKVENDGRKLVLKVVRFGKREPKYLEGEIKAMQELRHEHILSSEEIFRYDDCVCFIMEELESDLNHMINSDRVFYKRIRKWMAQLLSGIEYLHDMDIIHRDLDTSNVLVDENKNIKIADFGFARSLAAGDSLSPEVVSEQFNAPEMLFQGNYGYEVDMWSMGIIMATLAYKFPPFDIDDITEEVKKLLEDDNTFNIKEMCAILSVLGIPKESDWKGVSAMPRYPTHLVDFFPPLQNLEELDEQGNDFLQGLLQVVPSKRLTITQAKNHPYIRNYYEEETD